MTNFPGANLVGCGSLSGVLKDHNPALGYGLIRRRPSW